MNKSKKIHFIVIVSVMLTLFFTVFISVGADEQTENNVSSDTVVTTTESTSSDKENETSEVAVPIADAKEVAAPVSNETPANTETSNQNMSEEEKQRAIAQMGANQGDVWVWSADNKVEGEKRGPNGGAGQFNGGSVVQGGRPTYNPPASWYYLAYKGEGMTDEEAQAAFNKELNRWMTEFDPWGVIVEMSDNQASNAWADVRNMKAFVLRQNSSTWVQIVDHPEAVQWASQFKGNMSSNVGDANKSAVSGGGTSLEVLTKQDRVAHWGSDQARHIESPQTIKAVLVSVEARISDKSDPNAKLGIQVGGDWKFDKDESHPYWYPGAGLSGIQRLSKDWARYYFVSVTGIQDAMAERAITPEEFFASTVPLADMKKESVPLQESTPLSTVLPTVQALPSNEEKTTGNDANMTDPMETKPTVSNVSHSRSLPQTGSKNSYLLIQLFGLGLLLLGAQLMRIPRKNVSLKE